MPFPRVLVLDKLKCQIEFKLGLLILFSVMITIMLSDTHDWMIENLLISNLTGNDHKIFSPPQYIGKNLQMYAGIFF